MKDRLLQMIILGIRQFRDPYYQGFAAQISFYLMLSLVPILMLLTQILGYFDLSLEAVLGWLEDYTGNELPGMLTSLIEFSSASAAINIVNIAVALWAASRAQFAIMRISNYTFTDGESTGKGYWRERFRAVWTMAITLIALLFSVLILAYGGLIVDACMQFLPLDGVYLVKLIAWLRWLPAAVLYFLMICYIYYIMPTEKIQFRKILPGGLFACVGMMVVTIIYSSYVNNMANYDILYGTLSSIVALLFWFYFLAWVLCLGILINKVLDDTSDFSKRSAVDRGTLTHHE
jgi:membrane protein